MTNPFSIPEKSDIDALIRDFQQGATRQAIAGARAMLALHPEFAFTWKLLAAALDGEGQASEALEAMSKAADLLPGDAEVFSNLCVMLRRNGQLDAAKAAGWRAIELQPTFSLAHFNLGVALQDLGELAAAEACYRRVLDMAPGHVDAWKNLGTLLQNAGRFEDAEGSFRQALHLNPNDLTAGYGLGNTFFGQKRFEDAIDRYRQVTTASPGFTSAWFNLAVSLAKCGRHDEAIASLYRVLALNESDARAHYNLATCLLEMDDVSGAMAAYEQAIAYGEGSPISAEASVYLAVLHYLEGDRQHARPLLSKLARIDEAGGDGLSAAARAYRILLSGLLATDLPVVPSQPLHVIGESHALSIHQAQVHLNGIDMHGHSQWIWGCKQWHLGNPEANKFKDKFASCIARIPAGAPVLLLIGEIDCRPTEGILAAWRKSAHRSIEEIVQETSGNYVRHVLAATAKQGLYPILAGIPAITCNVDAPESDHLRLRLVRCMNSSLYRLAQANGCGFLDVYSLTAAEDGYTRGHWNIDPIHLTSAAYTEAFANFFHANR